MFCYMYIHTYKQHMCTAFAKNQSHHTNISIGSLFLTSLAYTHICMYAYIYIYIYVCVGEELWYRCLVRVHID